ncbi:MAG: alpha-2-macroglobulin [Odoribacter sp.]|nr:alpha-2-macroglobulin [Odoribacter sp.]
MSGCKQTGNSFSDAEISNYIYGYTSGSISASSPIVIYLERPLSQTFSVDSPLPEKIIKFSPSVKGTLYLREGNILEFVPEERMKNGQQYNATLNLGALIDVPKEYEEFKFRFHTIPLSGSMGQGKLSTQDNNDVLKYQGTIYTSDYIDDKELESKVKVNYSKGNPSIEWEHAGTAHHFTVSNISKRDKATILTLKLDSKFFGDNEKEISIPGTSEFSILNIELEGDDRKVIRIDFSENIDPVQEHDSFVSIDDANITNYKIQDNSLFVYFTAKDNAEYINVNVYEYISSTTGKKLNTSYTQTVSLPSNLPRVNFIGDGNIIPSGGNVLIPFSAVALKAVDVQIIKVFNQNMNSFLQDNNYNSYSSLTRTARPVFQKKIDLQTPERPLDLTRWNDFTINLSELIELEKGVVYRVRILYKKAYSILNCPDEDEYDENYLNSMDWDGDRYYSEYYYPYDYDWSERNNPCHNSYYYGNRFAGKNIINTSLGIVAKRDINNRYFVAVNDISTAQPIGGTKVVLYDYQNQPLDSATTDKDGFVYLQSEHKAFTVVAYKDKDKAWLKLNDGTALSLSNFNVSGENVESGLKGFIYGERGVWRPGDDIFLSFILENKVGKVPAGHPIIAQLTDPQGNITQTKKSIVADRAIYTFKFDTDEDSPTGYWTATIKIGGKSFTKTLRIETIKPNRLSINMYLPTDNILGAGFESSKLNVKTRWLHGALAPNKKAETEVRLQKTRYTFKNYANYSFTNDAISFEPTTYELFDGTTDAQGNFSFNLNQIDINNAPGVLNATFTTRVYEDGGDFSISSYTTKYSPFSAYVGFHLQDPDRGWYPTKKDVRVSGVVVNAEGEKINDSRKLNIKVYRQSWRWWWDSDDDEYGQYVNRSYNELVNEYTTYASDGEFSTSIRVDRYGRYFVEVEDTQSGHSAGVIGWFGSWVEAGGDVATVLNVSTDKNSYKPGEKIKITIPSSAGGTAIFSVESGRVINHVERVETKSGTTTYEIKATSEMCPNVYIGVTLIQPQKDKDNDRPIRMYGVTDIEVDDPKLHLNPVIQAPQEIRPAADFSVTVSEKDGKAMEYTIAVVDEGLLSITSFRTPNPFPSFYMREALGIKTWDFYDYIFGAYGARLEKAFAVGGDESLSPEQDEKNNRFKPVVLFEGPFSLKKREKKTHNLTMPDYIGEVRVMVVAANTKGQYGSSFANTTVKQPLMISVSMPRLFTPGDVIEVPVTVFAMNDNIRDVEIKAETDDLLELVEGDSRKITFNEKGDKIVWFKYRVKENVGIAKMKFTAQSGQEKATVEEGVEIRIPNPRITWVESKMLNSGETAEFNGKLSGLDLTSVLEISSIPPLNLGQRLPYLISYPYGCGEQITSGAFPQLSLGLLMDLTP